MTGVRGGKYVLVVCLPGYYEYRSKPFLFSEGEHRDMGAIPVNPCGVLDLEVKDEAGKPIPHYQLFCNGLQYSKWSNRPPFYRWDKLPLGEVKIRVNARVFLAKSIHVFVVPFVDTPHKLRDLAGLWL